MKKFKVFMIFLLSAVFLFGGTAIAYYNTRSFGFDEKVNIITYDNKSVTIYDWEIEYKEVEKAVDKMKDYMPKRFVTVHSGDC